MHRYVGLLDDVIEFCVCDLQDSQYLVKHDSIFIKRILEYHIRKYHSNIDLSDKFVDYRVFSGIINSATKERGTIIIVDDSIVPISFRITIPYGVTQSIEDVLILSKNNFSSFDTLPLDVIASWFTLKYPGETDLAKDLEYFLGMYTTIISYAHAAGGMSKKYVGDKIIDEFYDFSDGTRKDIRRMYDAFSRFDISYYDLIEGGNKIMTEHFGFRKVKVKIPKNTKT